MQKTLIFYVVFTKKIHKRHGTFFETKGNSLKQTYAEGEEVHVKRTGTNRGGSGGVGGEGLVVKNRKFRENISFE